MSDNEDDIKEDFEEFQEQPENIRDSNVEEFNNVLEKGRISDSLNIQLPNRYTMVDKNFNDDPEIIPKNIEIEKPKNKSKNKELKEKINDNNIDKSSINFMDLKIIVVGDVSVGKTSIAGRYVNNEFSEDYKCNISIEQKTKIIKEDDNNVTRLTIWDTAGQEKFRAITRQYYHDCDGAIITFDITSRKTFNSLDVWINDIKEKGKKDTVIIIMGNKTDLEKERVISTNEAKNKFDGEYLYFEVSAKNGNNISMAFDKLKKLIIENKKKNEEIELIKDEDNIKNRKKSKSKTKKNKGEKKTKLKKDKNTQKKNKVCF